MLHLSWLLVALVHTTFGQSNPANCTDAAFNWVFNSKGQSPCQIAEDLAGQCNAAGFNIPPLPLNDVYFGPTVAQANACQCSSVFYSLLSACGACQQRSWIQWSQYTVNCSQVFLTVYPKQIPADTSVPHWAYIDVSSGNDFNPTSARAIGGAESTAPAATSSSSAKSTSTSSPSHSSSNHAGAIAGGVIGGVVFLVLVAAALLWFFKFRNSSQNVARTLAQTRGQEILSTSPPPASWSPGAQPAYNPQKLYDPQDPSTFPPAADQLAPIMGQSLTGTTYNSYPDAQRNQHGHYTGVPEV